jgi:F-type H+-transporting ATPase subunit b
MSLITPDFGLLFWMLIIFGVVFFLLAKFGFPLITGMVEKRNEHIRESLRAAEQARLNLENLAAEQQKLIEQTRVEQGRMIKEAADTRAAMLAEAREQAGAEAAKVMEKARAQIEAEKNDAIREIRSQLSTLSVAVAEKVVRKEMEDSEARKALLETLIDEATQLPVN